jgi:hypothetical protein
MALLQRSGPSRIAVLLGVTACLQQAYAQEQPPGPGAEVVIAGCTGLSSREIARLVTLEVGALAAGQRTIPGLAVSLSCGEAQISINVDDPVTGKSLQRQIPAPAQGTPGAERMIALATAQLLRVSWMELLMATPPLAETRAPAPDPEVVAAAKDVAQKALAPEIVRAAEPNEISLALGAQWRDLTSAFPLAQVAVRFAHPLSARWNLCLQVAGEAGRAYRQEGAVNAWGAFAHLGGGWVSPRIGPVTFDATVLVGIGYLRLTGAPLTPAVSPGVVDGLAFDGRVGFGPTLHVGGFLLSAEAVGSYSTPRAIGEVAGERSVVAGGFAVGAGLRAGWAFGAN